METTPEKKTTAGFSSKWILICAVLVAVIAAVMIFKNKNSTDPNSENAFQALVSDANKGIPEAQNALGMHYVAGKMVPQDLKKAVELFRSAADKNCIPAVNNLGFCYYQGKGVEQDHSKAFELFQSAAERNYIPALYNLGECYELGKGVKKDMKKAVEQYQKAADAGMPAAKQKLEKLNKK